MNEWAYGHVKNKHLWIRHVLSEVVSEGIRARLDVGPAPRGGSGYTVDPAGYGPNQTSGPSYRIIADASNWDNSVATVNLPGQSGDPASPHYRDLFDEYVSGKHTPLFFSREKVESVTERTIRLVPQR
jgi:penicillin amidase